MTGEKQIYEISTWTIIKFFLVGISIWLLYVLRDIVGVLLASVVIASSIAPAASRLVRFRIPRVFAVVLIYVFGFSLIGFLFYLIVPPLVSEIMGFLSDLPTSSQGFEPTNLLSVIQDLPTRFNAILKEAIVNLEDGAFANGAAGLLDTVSRIFGGALSFIMIIVISFYLSVEEKGIENFLKVVTPKEYEGYALDLWNRCRKKIGLWLQGQLFLGLIVGILVFIFLTLLKVKYALLLAILSGLLEIIPVFGPILAAVPAIGVALTQSPILGLIVLGVYILIQQLENHIIYPQVIRKTIGVPPLLVILSIFIGGALAGFFGIMLAVPVATVIVEFVNDVARKKQIEF